MKRESYLFVAYSVGKWTQKTCNKMIDILFQRVELPFPNEKIKIFSDGNDDYEYVLPEYYADTCIEYGQVIKIREKGKVVDKIKRIIFGEPVISYIETTNIENFNSIMRERIGRLVRKTKCFSKRKSKLECAVELFQFYWNFMDRLPKKGTPAMIEGLTKHQWTWEEFLTFN